MTFDELDFKTKQTTDSVYGIQATVSFPNGYGASIIKSPYSYGGKKGYYKLALLHEDDVEGYLTPKEVTELLIKIEALPPFEGET